MAEVTSVARASLDTLCPPCTIILQGACDLGLTPYKEICEHYANHERARDGHYSPGNRCTLCKYIQQETGNEAAYPRFAAVKKRLYPTNVNEGTFWEGGWDLWIRTDSDSWFEVRISLWNPDAFRSQHNMRINDYRLVTSANSRPCITLIKRWIDDCIHTHTQCERPRSPSLAGWMPTRLVYCASPGSLKLVETKEIASSSPPRYMTLSHCWGILENPIRLTSALLPQWKKQLPNLERMKTFQDGITVTRDCGIDYLWIDSLCIIQDSEEDWIRESALMERVYKFSYCNISATSADDDTKGFFSTRAAGRPPFFSFEMPIPSSRSGGISESTKMGYFDIIGTPVMEEGIIHSRGWVVQERIMAPRVISFCERQLVWECDHTVASEVVPAGGWDRYKHNGRIRLFNPSHILCPPSLQAIIPEPLFKWMEIRMLYSTTKLTKRKDILVALSAIAREMQKQLACRYLAGIFETNVLSQMLWCVEYDERQLHRDGEAPSWSWASVQSWCEHKDYEKACTSSPLAEYRAAHVETRDGDIFGRIVGGSMELDGFLLSIKNHGKGMYSLYISEPRYSISSAVSVLWDVHPQSTEGFLCMPLFGGNPEEKKYGLALELVRPGIYRRAGLVVGPDGSWSGFSSWLDEYMGVRGTINPDTGEESFTFDKSKWQRIVII